MTNIKEGWDEDQGASLEDIASAISHRIMATGFPELVAQLRNTGKDIGDLTDAIEDVASFHEGATELGTSDISIMVRQVKKQLGLLESANEEVDGVSQAKPMEEAMTLDYRRYVRTHGKKPRDPGHSSMWMFSTQEYGMPHDDDLFQFTGSFADAKKAAAKWAKGKGAHRFYVMEDTILEQKEALNKEAFTRLHKVFDFSNFKGNEK
jgi:hypothetical protein